LTAKLTIYSQFPHHIFKFRIKKPSHGTQKRFYKGFPGHDEGINKKKAHFMEKHLQKNGSFYIYN